MKMKGILVFFGVMLVLTLTANFTATLTVPVVDAKKPITGKLTHVVTGEGKIEPKKYTYVLGGNGFSLGEVFVKGGDYVQAGTPLFRLNFKEIEKAYQVESLKLKKLKLMSGMKETDPVDEKTLLTMKRAEEDYATFVAGQDTDVLKSEEDYQDAEKEYQEAEEILQTFDAKYGQDTMMQQLFELRPEEISLLEQYIAAKEQEKNTKSTYEALKIEEKRSAAQRKYDLNQAIVNDVLSYFALQEEHPFEIEEENRVLRNAEKDQKNAVKLVQDLVAESEKYTTLKSVLSDGGDQIYKYQKDIVAQYHVYKKDYDEKNKSCEEAKKNYESVLMQKDENVVEKERNKERVLEDSELALKMQGEEEQKKLQDQANNNQLLQTDIALQQLVLEPITYLYHQKGVIKATSSGYVSEIRSSVGDLCATNPVLLISDERAGYRFTCEVDEKERAFLNVGDELILTDKKGKSLFSKRTISTITKSKNEDCYDITVDLEGNLEDNLGKVIAMRVESKTDSFPMCVPITALSHGEQYFVYAIKEEEGILGKQLVANRIDVEVLNKTELTAAIQGPITKEDLIIIESSKSISSGDRIRLKP